MQFGNFKYHLALLFFCFGSFYTNAQDSLQYYNNALSKALKTNNSDVVFEQKLSYLARTDNLKEYYYAFFDYFLANPKSERLSILKRGNEAHFRAPKTEDEKIAKLHLIINLAYHYKVFGNLKASITEYEKALTYFQKYPLNYDIDQYCLRALANNYTRIGDYQRAIDLYKLTLALAEQNKNTEKIVATYSNLSTAYNSVSQFDNAENVILKALEVRPLSRSQQSRLYSQLGKIYLEKQDYQKAIAYAEKSNSFSTNSRISQINQKVLGTAYLRLKDYKKANSAFLKALKLATEGFDPRNREVAKAHNLRAKLAIETKDYQRALSYYKSALKTLLIDYTTTNVDELPKEEKLYAENTLKEAFDGRAKVYTLLNEPLKAIENYHLAFAVDDLLRKSYSSQASKIALQSENRARSESVLALYFQLYKTTKNSDFAQQALLYAERSKSVILTEKFKERSLFKSNNDGIFNQISLLEKQKGQISNNIMLEELKGNKANVQVIKNLLSKKSTIDSELNIAKNTIAKQYPFLQDANDEIPFEYLLKNIPENSIAIEFFEGNTHLYMFTMNQEKLISFSQITIDNNYTKTLNTFFDLFAKDYGAQLKSDISTYKKTALALYNKLLKGNVESNQNIVLIVDGSLSFVPFDALLTKESTSSNYGKLPYLINEHKVSYAYSLNMLHQNNKHTKSESNSSFSGYFPVYENKERGLGTIRYTIDEANNIQSYFKGNYYLKNKATKQQFLAKENANIIHLSTHATAGTQQIPASIEFIDKPLYLPEIYGLSLNSDLLVLSACQTGIGKLQKGEGVMSLARGFSYAGVKNLIVSLWKVNDKSTSVLLSDFYKYYAKSNTINDALHQAKVDYINNSSISSDRKTPYYWAGFTHISNQKVQVQPKRYTSIILSIFFGSLIIIGIVNYFRRKKKT